MRKVKYLPLSLFVLVMCFLCVVCLRHLHSNMFRVIENGNIVSNSGIEYKFLAHEDILFYLGDLEFKGNIRGENKYQHLSRTMQTGMYGIKDSDYDNILVRYAPNNEWLQIYRKATLPDFDYSVDNCIRMEFVSTQNLLNENTTPISLGEISGQEEIAAFLSEVRSQLDAQQANLIYLVKKPDGRLENCYVCGVVYGFFAEEPNLVVRMQVTSYNDLAYSIDVEGTDYVLSEEWVRKLIHNRDAESALEGGN